MEKIDKKIKKWYVKINDKGQYVKCKKSESCGYIEGNVLTVDLITHQTALIAYYESLIKHRVNVNVH